VGKLEESDGKKLNLQNQKSRMDCRDERQAKEDEGRGSEK
jgi:hypothetical protein